MSPWRLDRRSVLRGAGGIALALPWLEAMAPARARAAVSPRRFVVFFSPNGSTNEAQFWPRTIGTDFTLGSETSPLMVHKKDLLVLSGLYQRSGQEQNFFGDLHALGMSEMLTCTNGVIADPNVYKAPGGATTFPGGISIDQRIAQENGKDTKFASLELGVQSILGIGAHPFSRMISRGPNQVLPAEDDPRQVWKRLFTDFAVPDGNTTIDQAREQRKSVLDFVHDDFARLVPKIGIRDRQKLDLHLGALREIEKRLAAPAPVMAACQPPGQPAPTLNPNDPKQFPQIGKLQMDLLVLALACDLTRVASLQWSWGRSETTMTWLPSVFSTHHNLSHNGPSEQLSSYNRWYAQQLAYLGSAMKAVDEGDGTLLDNSVVYWCSEVGEGSLHGFHDMRAFLLGSCGGFFKTGQHIRFPNLPTNQLMVTFMHAMGIADATKFGDPKMAQGPLPGLG